MITRRWRRSLVFGETRPTTPLVAGPPTAPAVAAEGASCAARAVPSDSVSCMLAARRVPTGRFADGVPGAGREPSASVMTKREQRGSVSPATRLQRSREICVTANRLSGGRMGASLLAAAEAATALVTSQWEPAPSQWEGCDFPLGSLRLPTGKAATSQWELRKSHWEIPLGAFRAASGTFNERLEK